MNAMIPVRYKAASLFRRTLWLYLLPLLLWMGVIFCFSAQPHSSQNLQPWLSRHLSDQRVEQMFGNVRVHYGGKEVSVRANGKAGFVEFWIRKFAHFFVYFVLGLLAIRLWIRVERRRLVLGMMAAALFCFLYAGSDEIHQYFTGDRTPMIQDVVLDSASGLIGIIVYAWFVWPRIPVRS